MQLSISKEDYLKAIAEAESEGEVVTAATVVRWLGVSTPAASMALKRLNRDGLSETDAKGVIHLKSEGREIAETLLRRHHLLERMLSEIFEFPWYQVHEEAERLEHAVSENFEKKLQVRFGGSECCPHGNRLKRDTPQDRRERGWMPLSECPPGRVLFRSVFERDQSLLEHLDRLGLRPGVRITVKSRHWDDTMTLDVNGGDVVLGLRAANLIWVEPLQ